MLAAPVAPVPQGFLHGDLGLMGAPSGGILVHAQHDPELLALFEDEIGGGASGDGDRWARCPQTEGATGDPELEPSCDGRDGWASSAGIARLEMHGAGGSPAAASQVP